MKNELYHHGILGMKWGKKNGPPYPLKAGTHSKSEKKAGWRKSLGGGRNEHLYDRKTNKKEGKASSKPSKDKRKIDRSDIFKAVGVGLLAVGIGTAGYLAYKKYGYKYLDHTLRKGMTLQTLSVDSDRVEKGRQYYATFVKADKNDYKAFFGKGRNEIGEKEILKYNISQKIISKIKVANDRSAFATFQRLYDMDEHFANSVQKRYFNFTATYKANATKESADKLAKQYAGFFEKNFPKATKQRTEELKKIYHEWNRGLVLEDSLSRGGNVTLGGHYGVEKFYEALKKKGFSAVVDVNDKGSLGKAPIIVFDKSKIIPTSARQLTQDEINKANTKYMGRQIVEQLADSGAFTTSSTIFGGALIIGGYATDNKYKKANKKK